MQACTPNNKGIQGCLGKIAWKVEYSGDGRFEFDSYSDWTSLVEPPDSAPRKHDAEDYGIEREHADSGPGWCNWPKRSDKCCKKYWRQRLKDAHCVHCIHFSSIPAYKWWDSDWQVMGERRKFGQPRWVVGMDPAEEPGSVTSPSGGVGSSGQSWWWDSFDRSAAPFPRRSHRCCNFDFRVKSVRCDGILHADFETRPINWENISELIFRTHRTHGGTRRCVDAQILQCRV